MKMRTKLLALSLALLVGSAAAEPLSPYQTPLRDSTEGEVIPKPLSAHVSDFAKLMRAEDVTRAQAAFAYLRRAHGIDAHLTTLNKVSDNVDLPYAVGRLAYLWNLDPGRGTHFLMVLLMADGRLNIHAGDAFDANGQKVINEAVALMAGSARSKDMSAALAEGAEYLARNLPAHLAQTKEEAAP